MFTEQEHEIARRQVWASVWNSVASDSDVKQTDTPTRYADAALKAYDERFSRDSSFSPITKTFTLGK